MHSIAIQTDCFDRSYWFYTEVVGLAKVREPFPFKTRTLAWLDAGVALIELYSTKHGADAAMPLGPANGIDHVAFVVERLDEVIAVLEVHGIAIAKGPLVPPSGDPRQPEILFVEAPEGTEVQFREPERP
ncbi:VOC family protein [Glycomyces xiaoerkulensis]|uniref:VOC family protein n=1 Tax=Glycomyces xiaoerkulensis TaxID=2038139 RepID=UPI0012FFE41D|nr:VOC family protein [Glycomyces xiaoerkulensis]